MKKNNFLTSVLLSIAIMFLSACAQKDETPPPVVVQDEQSLNQEVFADETTGKSAVNITTAGAWTSNIEESTQTRADTAFNWISISPDHGDNAGDYNIVITLTPNTSGNDRSATINISCNNTKITISITQKSTKQDGSVLAPKKYLPKRISGTGDRDDWTIAFEYDSLDRLVKLTHVQKEVIMKISYLDETTFRTTYTHAEDTAAYDTREYTTMYDSAYVNLHNSRDGNVFYMYGIRENGQMFCKNMPLPATSFAYDAAGNLIEEEDAGEGEHALSYQYTYDNRNGIYKHIQTPLWLLYDNQPDDTEINPLYFFVNNITEFKGSQKVSGEELFTGTYTYSYNNDGYPVAITFTEYRNRNGGETYNEAATIEYY